YLPGLMAAAADHELVVGSRYLHGISVVNWTLTRLMLSQGGNLYVRAVTGLPLRDCTSGFQVIRRAALERIGVGHIRTNGYSFLKFVYGSAELARGALPLWNPYEYAGVPFLGAAQPAVLYPPRVLLFALLPPTAALHVFMVVHYVLLGAGAFVMLRALALEVPGACLGALLLAFEPFMMAGHYHPPRIACFAWVPWMVAA